LKSLLAISKQLTFGTAGNCNLNAVTNCIGNPESKQTVQP